MTTTQTHPLRAGREESLGMVILDDPEGLAPRASDILRAAARRIAGPASRRRGLRRSRGFWPSTTVATRAGATDGAGRPGRTETTIRRGILARPALNVTTLTVNATRLMWWDPADYLLAVARLVEGGDGAPDASDLRRVAVASALCDRDPAHALDMVVLHTATAFEPVFLYDEGPRHPSRLESRILRVGDGLAAMIEALPRITRVTTFRTRGGVPGIALAPFADKASDRISDEDLELVGRPRHAVAGADQTQP